MALGKDRTKIASTGLGTVQVAELEPTPGEFADVGYIKNTTVTIDPTMVELVPETGEKIRAYIFQSSALALAEDLLWRRLSLCTMLASTRPRTGLPNLPGWVNRLALLRGWMVRTLNET